MKLKKVVLLPLGTCAANKTHFQEQSSYLLEILTNEKRYQILFDAGSSRVNNDKFVNPKFLRAIFLSHWHIDHTRYLGPLLKKLVKYLNNLDVTIFVNPWTWRAVTLRMLIRNGFITPRNIKLHHIHSRTYRKQVKFKLDEDFKIIITADRAVHSPDCIAYKVKIYSANDDKKLTSFVYTPDTKFDSYDLSEFAYNADYWLLDTTFHTEFVQKGKDNIFLKHSSPEYSAIMCEKANVGTYIVGHYFWERFGTTYGEAVDNIRSKAQTYFKGKIIVARDLEPITLYDSSTI